MLCTCGVYLRCAPVLFTSSVYLWFDAHCCCHYWALDEPILALSRHCCSREDPHAAERDEAYQLRSVVFERGKIEGQVRVRRLGSINRQAG